MLRLEDNYAKKHLASWTEQRRNARSEAMKAFYDNPQNRELASRISRMVWARDDGSRPVAQQEIARSLRTRTEINSDIVWAALNETGSIRGAARLLDCDRSVFRRFPDVMAAFKGNRKHNHRVIGIKVLPGDHDVYCLTVPEGGNFALEAGVFVRNCGIIVNVTPFEPE